MIIRYATKPNTNGNTYQSEIDNEEKTIKAGYFVFCGAPDVKATKKQINDIIYQCKLNNYKRI